MNGIDLLSVKTLATPRGHDSNCRSAWLLLDQHTKEDIFKTIQRVLQALGRDLRSDFIFGISSNIACMSNNAIRQHTSAVCNPLSDNGSLIGA